MNYQIGGNNQNRTAFGNVQAGNIAAGNTETGNKGQSILGNNQIGDLLACKLVKGGENPVLDLNGIQLQTKATEELKNAQPGDTIYLKIQQADASKVSLKVVGIQQQGQAANLGAATSAQVMQNTEQISDMIKDNLDGALDEEKAKENQKEILRNLTADEIAKLRMMQIDVSNAALSDLMGMVITIRSGEHREEVNEELGDIVKETIGKLRNHLIGNEPVDDSVMPVTEEIPAATDPAANADGGGEPAYRPGTSRLNSEGYVVNVPYTEQERTSPGRTDAASAGKQQEKVHISDEQMIYMIQNDMDFTIANVETARNSVNADSPAQEKPLDQQVWNDIYPQVTAVVEAAGMSVTEQSLAGAKFMLQHELPVTVDSLRMFMSVQALNQRGLQEPQLQANIEEQVAIGNSPEHARVSGSTLAERASQLVEKVQSITTSAVDTAVTQGKPLTISYLYNSTMRNMNVRTSRRPFNTGAEGASLSLSGEGSGSVNAMFSNHPAAVTARRQLEEIRLAMTMEAATRLVKQDINIDAKPLSKVVDALKSQEADYYEQVVSSQDLHDIPDGVDLLKETLSKTDGLKNLPVYALGEMVRTPAVTVGGLYDTASHMKATLMGKAYETMMTKPRADMGDSITDAFQNVDAILEDLDFDRNEANQRAVRILAYNQMEMTKENIVSVKSADAKVQQMFETLTPQIVLNLIRENKNPLNMTIDGLNEEIMQQKEIRGITDEQRFSEFLYQLDKTNGITQEERKSFIGIYRLLDKIEKSHGKDIGAVVRNGQDVTLHNLFTADKSRKVQGLNVAVDDSFGERENVNMDTKGILEQVETAYNQSLSGSILRHIKPQVLKNLEQVDYRNMSFEELNALVRAGDTVEADAQVSEELARTLQQALDCEEEVSMMLQANEMPATVTNILAAHQVMYGKDGIYGMIRDMKQGLSKESEDKVTNAEAAILEHMEGKQDVLYGLENIRAGLSEEIHAKEQNGTITAMDIQSLKLLNAGMPIAMRAVEQDVFQVPLVVDGKVSIMKISLLQDGEHAGEITATMDTPRYGKLESFIHVENDQIEGYVTLEKEEGQHILESNELTFRSVFAKIGMEVRDLRFDGSKPAQYGLAENGEVTTGRLYKVAKQLMTAVKFTGVAADK